MGTQKRTLRIRLDGILVRITSGDYKGTPLDEVGDLDLLQQIYDSPKGMEVTARVLLAQRIRELGGEPKPLGGQ